MLHRLSIMGILILALTLVACVNGVGDKETLIATDPGFNLLVVAESEVQLKRDGWSDFYHTTFGAVLYRGDQLRLLDEAKAVVLCDNLTVWTVPPGAPSGVTNGCPPSPDPPLVSGESQIGSTRGGSDPLIPYIISPRKTKVLTGTPVLRWNTVPNVISYTVRIRGEGVDWKIETRATEIAYSGGPRLKPGVSYLLVVKADNGKSSQDEGVPGLGFGLADDNEAQHVHATAEQISKLSLSNEAKSFALAQSYAGHEFVAEAIETLEELINAKSQTPAVYRAVAALYRQIDLNRLAEERYLYALELSQQMGDIEGQALAQNALGLIYAALGNTSESVQRLQKAKAIYQKLGDTITAQQIQDRIAELLKPR
ncbi:MAG TPA: tetratricopeptide repeat protein [Anaerolineae bacterium]|nr:tetratricopeptide repeat protein [Anaerolineae bacterium]